MRGDCEVPIGPYHTWVVRVEEQNRVRVPLSVRQVVPWLGSENDFPSECVAAPGVVGVQLFSAASYEAERRLLDDALAGALEQVRANESWVDAARLLGATWRVRLSLESTRISLTLPEPLRRANELPSAGGMVAVFALGAILELCEVGTWFRHVRELGKERGQLIHSAVERLSEL
jgi:hypothetical protein